MKALKIIGNIFGILLAIIMSIVLLVMLIITPVISSLTLVVEPETIHAVVTQPEVVEMIAEIPVVSESLDAAGMDKEFVGDVVQSQFFEDFIHLYTEETINGVTGEREHHVTVSEVQQVIANNKDEVIDLVRPISGNYTDDGEIGTDEEIEEMIDYAVETYGEDFLNALPSGQALLDLLNGYSGDISGLVNGYGAAGGNMGVGAPLKMDLDVSDLPELDIEGVDEQQIISVLVKNLLDGTITKAMLLIIIVISVLVLLLRWPRFKGLMWLAVTYLIGGFVMYGCSALLLYRPFEEELAHYFHIAVVIFELMAARIRTYAVAFLIVGAVCLVLFIVGRILLNVFKKRAKARNQVIVDAPKATPVCEPCVVSAVEEAPVAEETPVVEETPAVEEAPIEEEAPVVEEAFVAEEAPAEEAPASVE